MKPHPRIRKTFKWGSAAVALLLLVVWIGSGWLTWAWHDPAKGFVALGGGVLNAGRWTDFPDDMATWDQLQVHRNGWCRFRLYWRYSLQRFGRSSLLSLPLWIPVLATSVLTGIAWGLDALASRRERRGLCPKCTYSRTGLAADARCPECGTLPKP